MLRRPRLAPPGQRGISRFEASGRLAPPVRVVSSSIRRIDPRKRVFSRPIAFSSSCLRRQASSGVARRIRTGCGRWPPHAPRLDSSLRWNDERATGFQPRPALEQVLRWNDENAIAPHYSLATGPEIGYSLVMRHIVSLGGGPCVCGGEGGRGVLPRWVGVDP